MVDVDGDDEDVHREEQRPEGVKGNQENGRLVRHCNEVLRPGAGVAQSWPNVGKVVVAAAKEEGQS